MYEKTTVSLCHSILLDEQSTFAGVLTHIIYGVCSATLVARMSHVMTVPRVSMRSKIDVDSTDRSSILKGREVLKIHRSATWKTWKYICQSRRTVVSRRQHRRGAIVALVIILDRTKSYTLVSNASEHLSCVATSPFSGGSSTNNLSESSTSTA